MKLRNNCLLFILSYQITQMNLFLILILKFNRQSIISITLKYAKDKRNEINNCNDKGNNKQDQGKFNFATHFINTSTTYDKNADLKNATFDEKLKTKNEIVKPKKLMAPLNMKKNARKM